MIAIIFEKYVYYILKYISKIYIFFLKYIQDMNNKLRFISFYIIFIFNDINFCNLKKTNVQNINIHEIF